MRPQPWLLLLKTKVTPFWRAPAACPLESSGPGVGVDCGGGLFSSEGLESVAEETNDKLLDLQQHFLRIDGPPVSTYHPPSHMYPSPLPCEVQLLTLHLKPGQFGGTPAPNSTRDKELCRSLECDLPA